MTENQKQLLLYQRQHKIYARRIYALFLNALKGQIQPVIDWIVNTQSVNPPVDSLIDAYLVRNPIVRAYDMIGVLSAERSYKYMQEMEYKGVLSFLVDKWRDIFRNYSIHYAYRIENKLAETTKNEIRTALTHSYNQNLNADQTAAYIRKRVQNEITRARANTIARTEATTASNLGKEVGARTWLEEQGQRGYKQWLGRADGKERDSHLALNDEIIPLDTLWVLHNFETGVDEFAMNPGDTHLSGAERINCRCTFVVMSERRYNRMQQGN